MSALPQTADLDAPSLGTGSYTLHHRAECQDSGLACWIAIPQRHAAGKPPLVAVHGIRRGARDQALLYAERAADQGRTVIAPLYEKACWPRYQQLVRKGRADLALIRLMATLKQEGHWQSERFSLAGFSGGAQFAHRFAMLHPDLLSDLTVASAGWYSFPDETAFPYGLGSRADRSSAWRPDWGPRFAAALDRFLRLPIKVAVGARDKRRDANTRSGEAIDRQQGLTRLERAERWAEAINAAARRHGLTPNVSFTSLPGCGHDFRTCIQRGGLDRLVLPTPATDEPARRQPFAFPSHLCATASP